MVLINKSSILALKTIGIKKLNANKSTPKITNPNIKDLVIILLLSIKGFR